MTANDAHAAEQPLAVVRRWEDSGGLWRVLTRSGSGVQVALLTCDAGEEMARVTSSDPDLLSYLAGRDASDEPGTG